jgi:hypothetical protein
VSCVWTILRAIAAAQNDYFMTSRDQFARQHRPDKSAPAR